jgi:hypothetical protein
MTNKELSEALKLMEQSAKQAQENYEQCFLDVTKMQETLDDIERANRDLQVKLNLAGNRIVHLTSALKSSVAVL